MLSDLIRRIRARRGPDGKYYRIMHDMLGVTPRNIELYKVALIHRSASIVLSSGQTINNERLEFLGMPFSNRSSRTTCSSNSPISTKGSSPR